MINKKQELLNCFYELSQEIKKDKCMRLSLEDIVIIKEALCILNETDINIAKEQYEKYLKEYEKL